MTTTETNLIALINEVRKLSAERMPDRIDPRGDIANKLRAMIAKVDNADGLRIIANANIKWASSMALAQLIIRGERP
jgi:hypothetical protein